jgi:hypothetical protein
MLNGQKHELRTCCAFAANSFVLHILTKAEESWDAPDAPDVKQTRVCLSLYDENRFEA